eukprot:403343251
MENFEIDIIASIGFQSQYKDCFAIHPTNDFCIYAVGSNVVIKSLLVDNSFQYLKGHEGRVCAITVSQSGKLLASGEELSDQGFQAALIVWNFFDKEMLYRVKFHKQRVQAFSFSCNDQYLVSLGGKVDGNQIVIWNMEEGKSECLQAASPTVSESCQDIKFMNRNPNKFMTVHNNAVKFWTFDNIKHKFNVIDCQLGHVKRYINCLTIDESDTYAYCGTRTGDLIEIYIEKATFKRVGPLNRIFVGGINTILATSYPDLLIGAGDGTIAKINKKTMKISDGFSEVFASCSGGEIRIWKVKSQQELLRIDLAKTQENIRHQCNSIEFMSDGKSLITGWTDGKIRAFLPQSGKLFYVINDAHKNKEVTALTTSVDCSKIVSGDSDGEIRLWHIGKQVQKLLMNQKQHTKRITSLQILLNDQQVASGSLDGNIIIWNLMSTSPLQKLKVLSPQALDNENIKKGVLSLAYCYKDHVLLSCIWLW